MSRRRPIHRKANERPASRKGLLLCLLLAGAVVLVPVGGGFITVAKTRLRDAALASGFINLDDCVVTAKQTLACGSGIVGTPLPVALHQISELQAQAADDARRAEEAEANLRTLAVEVERLNAEAERNRLAAAHEDSLPPVVTTVTRTGSDTEGAASLPIQVVPNPAIEPVAESYEPAAEQ